MVAVTFPTLLIATVLQRFALCCYEQSDYFTLFMRVGGGSQQHTTCKRASPPV